MSARLEDLLPQPETKPAVIEVPQEGEGPRFRILTRVSDDKLRSIPQQVQDCVAYIESLAQQSRIEAVYNLGEHSGFSMTQSAVYQRLLEDARLGRFDALVVRDSSRLGRDYWEKMGTLRDLRAAKVQFHVVEEGGHFDFEESLNKVRSFASSWADEEKKREEIRKAVRATDSLREMGLPTVKPPLGYKSVKDASVGRRVWREDRDAVKVRAIFESYLEDPDQNLSELGRSLGLAPYQVVRVLDNRCYTGGFVWKGEFRACDPRVVPPLVDAAVFERVQELRRARKAG